MLAVRPKWRQGLCEVSCRASNLVAALVTHLRSPRHRALIKVLVKARCAAGLTQRQLAVKLGRSNSFVWKFEAAERQINVLEFIEIASILGVKASTLIKEIET